MFNRPDSRALWRREYLSIGGRNGPAMVVRGNDANNNFARLQTPNLVTNDAKTGCMRFQYFIKGRKPASLSVIKQGFVTKYIFANGHKTEDHWETAEVEVEFLGDKVMFYFEADTKVQEYGDSLVAFTDLTILTHSCQQK
ncbi:MAM domain-containing protein [Caerostris darwini]|uniref:MAM domain-containing protein n=1 Tax=Caerostris darwini TaxID=1538125 RepID=A0AAV4Q2D9_9ARAC|nr:MAM domain-containing protein [Caerostris darwini]